MSAFISTQASASQNSARSAVDLYWVNAFHKLTKQAVLRVYVAPLDGNISWWYSLSPTSAAPTDSASVHYQESDARVKNTPVILQHFKLPSFTTPDLSWFYNHGQISFQDVLSLLPQQSWVLVFWNTCLQAHHWRLRHEWFWMRQIYAQTRSPWFIMF